MESISFIVNEAEEGGYYAEAPGKGIFAEGATIDDLKENIKSGIECYYDDNITRFFTTTIKKSTA